MKKVLLFFALMLAMAAQADVLSEYSFVGTLGVQFRGNIG